MDAVMGEDLQILVFNIMGVRFGIDVQQVDQIESVAPFAKLDEWSFYLHDKLPFKKPVADYQDAKKLFLKSSGAKISVIIDMLEDVISLDDKFIRPVPKLLQKEKGTWSYWGIALVDPSPILLIDFAKLAAM